MNNDIFLKQFEMKTLDPKQFNNLAHIRITWLYLNLYEYDSAVNKICDGIQNYALSQGATNKFDKALTIVIIEIIYLRMQGTKSICFQEFITQNPDLNTKLRTLVNDRLAKRTDN